MSCLESAISALRSGSFVVLHDAKGREDESDLVCLAEKITPEMVRQMRKDAGGLICVAIDAASSRRLSLPFAVDMLKKAGNPLLFRMGNKYMRYGDKPAFTISINHLSTFTGITDNDRAKTIREFGRLIARRGGKEQFRRNFRAIGHVFLLSSRGLERRRGHTELSVALAQIGRLTPAVALCEMLSDNGKAASGKEASEYAERHGYPFVEGRQIIEAAGLSQKGLKRAKRGSA
ncbi:MAG: 3,4-dihydroxy-2-butanone-4-phosphate synthase [Candidatus Micrarchaeota archaeon]|nr:3,4-dihydroxy-2-butanone-4-phosphate synthase [Candidatus Micrarchaeota archaeon]